LLPSIVVRVFQLCVVHRLKPAALRCSTLLPFDRAPEMGLFGSKQQQQPSPTFSDDEDDAMFREQRAAEDIAQHRSMQHDDFPSVPVRPPDVVLSIPAPATSLNGSGSSSAQNPNVGPPWWLTALESLPLSKELLLTSPTDSSFVFDLSAHVNEAKQIIGLFPSVNLLRLKLVPARINDETFWRNLFWHLEQFRRFGTAAIPSSGVAPPSPLQSTRARSLPMTNGAAGSHLHAHSEQQLHNHHSSAKLTRCWM